MMARSIKDAGVEELAALKKRVIRQHALGRIGNKDHIELVDRIDKLEAYIVNTLVERTEDRPHPW